jgi:uncharacterized protein YbjT (DUF2867 family)
MEMTQIAAVTGSFGYSGKYITQRLLDVGQQVITLTNSLYRPNPFGNRVKAYPFDWDNPDALTETLSGVSVLYNTYWVRFNHKTSRGRGFTHSEAVENTLKLFNAAKAAGVQRVVHVSITNPDINSPLEYFSGKARLEEALINSGLSYAILRPTVLFGPEDILINNIAWMLRRFPIFGVFGRSDYCLQPIYVDNLAQLAVEHGQSHANAIINAIGPETFTYRDLISTIGKIIGAPRPVVSISPRLGYWIGAVMGRLLGDVTITWQEIEGLMANLLYVDTPAAGTTRLTEWVRKNRDMLGKHYANELSRRTLK